MVCARLCVLLIEFVYDYDKTTVNNIMHVDLEFSYGETTAAMDLFSQKDIDELRNWTQKLDKSKLVPKNLSDKQLVLFYNACYGDMDKTKSCLEMYYACRRNAPEFFDHRVLKEEDLRKASEVVELLILPGKSCDGYQVIYHRLHDTDSSNFDLESFCKLLFMTVDLCLSTRGPQSGYIFLFDMQGVKFGHLTRISLLTLRKLFQYIQEAIPVRMQAIHVLNTEAILDKLMALIKPFVDKKFFDMIKIHKKNEEMNKLYEIVPRSSLPSDYGGSIPDTQTLHKQCMEELKLLEHYFKAEEEQRLAALPDKNRGNTLEGTFKKLNID